MQDYNLERFHKAQGMDYQTALQEIKSGRRCSHWIWYIFPQLKGLGYSFNSEYYGIADMGEARAYLSDKYLADRLHEICEALLALEESNPYNIFGSPDDKKVKSCMTLFVLAADEPDSIYEKVLDKFYNGQWDNRTLHMLNMEIRRERKKNDN